MSVSAEQRIAELEAKVRQQADIIACIPMAAVALNIIPLDLYASAMHSPVEAMKVLEEIAGRAEICQAMTEELGPPCEEVAKMVDRRRRRIQVELESVLR